MIVLEEEAEDLDELNHHHEVVMNYLIEIENIEKRELSESDLEQREKQNEKFLSIVCVSRTFSNTSFDVPLQTIQYLCFQTVAKTIEASF